MAEADWFGNLINTWIFLIIAYFVYIIGWWMYLLGNIDFALDTMLGLEMTPPAVTTLGNFN